MSSGYDKEARIYLPSPRLLILTEHCDGRVIESGQKCEVDNVADALVDVVREIEDETGGVRNVSGLTGLLL